MKFRADEISSVIQREIQEFQAEVTRTEVGRVLEVGDGIARIHGLSGVMTGEMVEFESQGAGEKVRGLAFNLEESSVGVIILGDFTNIHEGETVTATGQLLRVPVGDAPAHVGVDGQRLVDRFSFRIAGEQFRAGQVERLETAVEALYRLYGPGPFDVQPRVAAGPVVGGDVPAGLRPVDVFGAVYSEQAQPRQGDQPVAPTFFCA